MAGVSKLIDDKTIKIAHKNLENLGRYGALSIKLKAVLACSENTITAVSEVFKVSRVTLTNWIKSVKAGQIEDLIIKPGRGRSPIISKDYHSEIKGWLIKNPNLTTDDVCEMIFKKFGIKVGRTATYNLIKMLGLSYITPRPSHHKSDKELQDAFKKTSGKSRKTRIS
jgi:transposase